MEFDASATLRALDALPPAPPPPAAEFALPAYGLAAAVGVGLIALAMLGRRSGALSRRLHSRFRRGLFSLAVAALVPWLCIRVIGEIVRSSGGREYAAEVLVRPLELWAVLFSVSAAPRDGHWFDWLVLPALVGLVVSLSTTGPASRFLAWLRGEDAAG